MESSNVVINDEVCPEAHSESTAPVQDKPMKVNDLLPIDYVGKYSDEELMVLMLENLVLYLIQNT